LEWELVKKFESIEEAKAHVKAEKKWTQRYVRKLISEGTKHTYDCVTSRDCPAKIYLMEGETSVDLYSTTEEHTHADKIKRYGLSEEVKANVTELWESGVKRPQKILSALKKKGIELPKITQVASYIQKHLRSKQ